MNASVARKTFIGVAAVLAAFYLAFGVATLLGMTDDHDVDRLSGLFGIIPATVIAAGLWLRRQRTMLGEILVILGAVPVAVIMFWTIFTPILGVLTIVFWLVSRRVARQRDPIG